MRDELPEFRDWSVTAVRLLQGVVEVEDGRPWDILLSNVSSLESYFARLGLRLIIDELEGLAYLRQLNEDETPVGYDTLPKLFRATRMGYGQTLLCVLLRDALRRFEDEETRDERCVITETDVLDQWKTFFPQEDDDVRQSRDLYATFRKLEELGFVKKFGDEDSSWEIRRIIKARLTADELEHLHEQLRAAVFRRETQEKKTATK